MREKKVKVGNKLNYIPDNVGVDFAITIDSNGKLHFPVLLLYDEHMTTDFIQDWQEDVTLRKALTPIFASQAPWDPEGDYTMQTIEVYFEADQTEPYDPKDAPKEKSKKKYVKCELNQTLIDVLGHPNHMMAQYPILKIVSTDTDFRESFLSEI